jgi:hypothetical protein
MTGLADLLLRGPWFVIVAVVILGVVVTVLRRERYHPPPSEWTLPTTEVFIDPETGRRHRVYINPASGARSYQEEDPAAITYPPLERPGLIAPPLERLGGSPGRAEPPSLPPAPPSEPPGR